MRTKEQFDSHKKIIALRTLCNMVHHIDHTEQSRTIEVLQAKAYKSLVVTQIIVKDIDLLIPLIKLSNF